MYRYNYSWVQSKVTQIFEQACSEGEVKFEIQQESDRIKYSIESVDLFNVLSRFWLKVSIFIEELDKSETRNFVFIAGLIVNYFDLKSGKVEFSELRKEGGD